MNRQAWQWKGRAAHQARGMVKVAALLCSLLVAFTAHANTIIYKWVDGDGVTTYAQKPPRDVRARDVQTIELESLPADQRRAADRMLSDLQRQSETRTVATQRRLEAADLRVAAAINLLAQAEADLAAGSTPAGDDRIGLATGGTRLTENYFERVARLQANVDHARRVLDDAYAARNGQ